MKGDYYRYLAEVATEDKKPSEFPVTEASSCKVFSYFLLLLSFSLYAVVGAFYLDISTL